MNAAPTVSILLPTHNGQKTIGRAVRSVLAQTFSDWELLILDDGSSAEARPEIDRWVATDPRIRLERSRKNLGLVETLNRGLDDAQGRLIARIDDDDEWILPTKLERQVGFLASHPDHLLVGTQAEYAGARSGRYPVAYEDGAIRRRILIKNQFVHSSVLFRNGGYRYDPMEKHVEDYALWLHLLCLGRGANLPDVAVRYTKSPESISQKRKREQALNSIRLTLRLSSSSAFSWPLFQIPVCLLFNGLRIARTFVQPSSGLSGTSNTAAPDS